MPIEAELRRRLANGTLVDWILRDAVGGDEVPTDPVSDAVARSVLQAISTKLDALAVSVTGTVGVNNFPATQPVSLTTLPAGSNILGFTSSTVVRKVLEHKVFRSGGEVTTSVTNPNASMTLTNPAGNTKTLYLIGIAVYADAAAPVTFYTDAVSTGTLKPSENMNIGSPVTSTAEARLGAGVISGGREWALRARVQASSPIVRDVFVPLAPGRSVSVRFLGPGATNLVTFNGTWYEEVPT